MSNRRGEPPRSIRVRDELWQAVKVRAAQRGETVSAVIVRALEAYVASTKRGQK